MLRPRQLVHRQPFQLSAFAQHRVRHPGVSGPGALILLHCATWTTLVESRSEYIDVTFVTLDALHFRGCEAGSSLHPAWPPAR